MALREPRGEVCRPCSDCHVTAALASSAQPYETAMPGLAFGMPTEDDGSRDDPLLSERSWAVSSCAEPLPLERDRREWTQSPATAASGASSTARHVPVDLLPRSARLSASVPER
jgi:hypothetical protein